MNIKIKNFEITADDRQYILKEWVVPDKKDKKPYLSTIGFYASLESLLTRLLHLRLARSDATTLKEILEETKDFQKKIKALLDQDIKLTKYDINNNRKDG